MHVRTCNMRIYIRQTEQLACLRHHFVRDEVVQNRIRIKSIRQQLVQFLLPHVGKFLFSRLFQNRSV